jgi:hypothetical protein
MIPFKKGDKVRMTSDYDLTKYRLYVHNPHYVSANAA